MKPLPPPNWAISPREAIDLQQSLRERVQTKGRLKKVRTIAGADIAWHSDGRGVAGVVLYDWTLNGLRERERAQARDQARFPYVPGLLSFRESPLLLQAFARLHRKPDLVFIDGHGLAHPRRFGIACHMGLLLGRPTIGCAKSRLIGDYAAPANLPGAHSPLMDKGEIVGAVLRTRQDVSPVFISVGTGLSLAEALHWADACSDGFRIPRPTRDADGFVAALKNS